MEKINLLNKSAPFALLREKNERIYYRAEELGTNRRVIKEYRFGERIKRERGVAFPFFNLFL